MKPSDARFVFDYVDPGSYLLHQVLARAGEAKATPHPFELRPPPEPVIDPGDPRWVALYGAMKTEAKELGVPLERPTFVPWSRKAHELALQAGEKGCFEAVHEALFRAYFGEGLDIGRVDVLVAIGVEHGLDASETRAALDVDRQREALEQQRAAALDWAIRGVPTLLLPDGRRLEGFHGLDAVRAFLGGPQGEGAAG